MQTRLKAPDVKPGVLDRDIYRVAELTIILGLNRDTIHKAITNGELPAIDYGGSSGKRVLHEDVVKWLKGKRTLGGHAMASGKGLPSQ